MKNILVTGGAGYIGSHIVEQLIKLKKKVIIIDNLSTGFKELVNKKSKFYKKNILNTKKIKQVILDNKIDSVIHLAGSLSINIGEKYPRKYFKNNVVGSKNLLKACIGTKVKNFLFSSSAAVYKDGLYKVSENSILKPKSVYGKTKLQAEKVIKKECKFNKINYGILRFFNVVGASSSGKIGLINKGGHLFKNFSNEILKKKPKFKIYGKNYNTPDKTTIRDYIHVSDLSEIHIKVLKKISKTNKSIILNCGYGKGISVLKVLKEFKKHAKSNIKIIFLGRRKGDMEKIIANNKKLLKFIKWKPKYEKLKILVKSSIAWEKNI